MANYKTAILMIEFGRIIKTDEVHDLVPLILIDGGPHDEWVFDSRDFRPERPPSEWADALEHFAYAGQVAKLEDGRLARVYRPSGKYEHE